MKTVVGFPSYCVTKQGHIWSTKSGKWLRPYVHKHNGCLLVSLSKNGRLFRRTVHRLVLDAFVSKRPRGKECRHLNGDPKDNRLENLKWGTHRQNIQDAIKHGTHQCLNQNGERNSNTKLTGQNVKTIICMYKTKQFTQQNIAGIFQVSNATISRIVNKVSWRHI